MKKIFFYLISVAMMGYASCSKEKAESSLPYGLPGTIISDMAFDNNHMFYFVTSEIDRDVEISPVSSFIPYRHYLSRKSEKTGKVEILDKRYTGGKLYFDKNNRLLTFDSYAIYRFDGSLRHAIFEVPDRTPELSFIFMAVDNDNNIWAGGYQTGLYKIDNYLNVTHYHENNSELPTNYVTNIHIDKNNDIWIVTGRYGTKQGLVKISDGQWVVYDLNFSNSQITSLVTDQKGNVWMGMGWENEDQTLICFDGTSWETVHPRNDKNELVKGTVHYLQSNGRELYVVMRKAETIKENYSHLHVLLTFDGVKWNRAYEIPEGDWIVFLIVDDHRQVVWISTNQKGLFKIPFHVN